MRYLLGVLLLGSLGLNSHSYAKDFQLVSKEREKSLRKFLPKTEELGLKKLYQKHLIFYTEAEMPPAFQHEGSVYSTFNNFSAAARPGSYPAQYFGGQEPYGNANREFPWGSPAGLHNSKNFTDFKFIYLPTAVEYWTEVLPGEGAPFTAQLDGEGGVPITIMSKKSDSYVWKFPVGTVFGEVLLVEDKDGCHETFELRTRTRQRKGWTINVYRPFPTRDHLLNAIQHTYPHYEKNNQLKRLVTHLESTQELSSSELKNSHPKLIFQSKALDDNLPAIPEEVVRKLLRTTPFRLVGAQVWHQQGGKEAYAPTTKAGFHIVPKDYKGSHLEISSKACMQCHDTCQLHVSHFQNFLNPQTLLNRDWYGLVRGSDNIFSFHIFNPSCINNRRQDVTHFPVVLNRKMLDAGILRRRRR